MQLILFPTGATPAFQAGKSATEASSSGPIAETFKLITDVISPDVVKSTQGVYKFELSGESYLKH